MCPENGIDFLPMELLLLNNKFSKSIISKVHQPETEGCHHGYQSKISWRQETGKNDHAERVTQKTDELGGDVDAGAFQRFCLEPSRAQFGKWFIHDWERGEGEILCEHGFIQDIDTSEPLPCEIGDQSGEPCQDHDDRYQGQGVNRMDVKSHSRRFQQLKKKDLGDVA